MSDIEATGSTVQDAAQAIEAMDLTALFDDAGAGTSDAPPRAETLSSSAEDGADEGEELQEQPLQASEDTPPEATAEVNPDEEGEPSEEGDAETYSLPGTLTELAEELEMSIDDLASQLQHTVKVDGEEVQVTLAEAFSGFQKDGDYRKKTARVAEQSKALEQEKQTFQQERQQTAQMLQDRLAWTEQLLIQDLNSEKMKALREDYPEEWTAQQHEFSQKLGAVQQARAQAFQEYQQQQHQERSAYLADQAKKLFEKLPNWKTEAEKPAKEALESLGFTEQDIDAIPDHRVFVMASELATLRKQVATLQSTQANAKKIASKVKRTVPRTQKPNQGKSTAPKRNLKQRLQRRARETGRVDDAAAAIEAQLFGG